jgi:polysaccharide export outer membrane protein
VPEKEIRMMHNHILTKGFIGFLGLLLWAGSLTAQTADDSITLDDYKVNPGDVINVSVWKEEGMTSDVLIRPDGKFSFPLAGDIEARGKSVDQIREILTKRLSRYIPDLVVSVSVLQVSGNRVYVIGQVPKPGEIIVNPQIDVMQALSMAGGTTPFADANSIKILRRTQQGLITIPFSYGDVEKGKRLEQNIMLKAGDVVVVP